MLYRQRTLLSLVQHMGSPVDSSALTTLAFLLRNETQSQGGNSFYDFLPYHTGPCSFGLLQEAGKLAALGYLADDASGGWSLGTERPPENEPSLSAAARQIAAKYGEMNRADLDQYVCTKYPKFRAEPGIMGGRKRQIAKPAVYTSGYESKSIDAFLNGLVEAGIQRLIDVRNNPIARRYGFHRTTLQRLCGHLDIEYWHLPELGIRSELRKGLDPEKDHPALLDQYEVSTLEAQSDSVRRVATGVAELASVLVCMEMNPACCHRSRLAEKIGKLTRLPVVHLP